METFSVGQVISKTFNVWLRNLLAFVSLSVLLNSPLIICVVLKEMGVLPIGEFLLLYTGLALIVGVLAAPLLSGIYTFTVIQQLRGEHPSLSRSFRVGLSRLVPILGVSIIFGLVTTLGFLALLVPGIILYLMFMVAIPACVVERTGVFESLGRSQRLTSGYKWQLFLLLLILLGIWIVPGMIVGGILFAVSPDFFDPESTARISLDLGVAVVEVTFRGTLVSVVYNALRNAREGTTLDELAKVFE